MDFSEFLEWSQRSRLVAPRAYRLCETRIAQAYCAIRPVPEPSANPPEIHRCDLALLWCATRGIEATLSPTALACEGVRHALQIIFQSLARRRMTIALPADVYPVYWQLSAQARLPSIGFETFPSLQLSAILRLAAMSGASVALLPQPLKLHGRILTEEEVDSACDWLHGAPDRRIILDGVYGFGSPLDSRTKRLIATDQVLFLDSLSKGWLHERVFGIAMVPQSDLPIYSATFRSLIPDQPKLLLAHALLTKYRDFPNRILEDMATRRAEFLARAQQARIPTLPVAGGYLVAIQGSAPMLLAQHSLLAIPATAFGSRLRDWSIASVLPTPDTAS